MADPDPTRVADALVRGPTVHSSRSTVGQIRGFFLDEHVHMALLVEGRRLVGAIERDDLRPELDDDLPARVVGTLRGRAVRADALAHDTLTSMRRNGRRRLVVTDEQGLLVGLLCLKTSGRGFCSDEDVANRRLAQAA
jgi:predicted transcriptional regulator